MISRVLHDLDYASLFPYIAFTSVLVGVKRTPVGRVANITSLGCASDLPEPAHGPSRAPAPSAGRSVPAAASSSPTSRSLAPSRRAPLLPVVSPAAAAERPDAVVAPCRRCTSCGDRPACCHAPIAWLRIAWKAASICSGGTEALIGPAAASEVAALPVAELERADARREHEYLIARVVDAVAVGVQA